VKGYGETEKRNLGGKSKSMGSFMMRIEIVSGGMFAPHSDGEWVERGTEKIWDSAYRECKPRASMR
jgi:hypothetical protein